jgi:t-SNARE complex subunit (syntaxin)
MPPIEFCMSVDPTLTEEQIDERTSYSGREAEGGSTSSPLPAFAGDMVDQAAAALLCIESRHADILKLEASIKELDQLFIDLAMLVRRQSGVLDDIESNVRQAWEHIEVAKDRMRDASLYQRKSKKKRYILLSILIILVAASLAIALGLHLRAKAAYDAIDSATLFSSSVP